MSHRGGQPSCTTVSLGKKVRRALRAAVGMKKKKKNKLNKYPAAAESDVSSSSMERTSCSFSSEAAAARKESVVRVVLKSGVVEVYPSVVLACTVIRKHPPGLCLAHPDVFRNPHGAVVRPLEPLFPGQKFLLLPETTVVRLKQKIPSAFADDEEDEEDPDDDYSYNSGGTSTAASSSEEDHDDYNYYSTNSGITTTASSSSGEEEEKDDTAVGDDGGSFMSGRSAREFYVANDRWSERRFKRMVECGRLGARINERMSRDQPVTVRNANNKDKKKKTKRRKDRRVSAPAGFRTLTRSPPRRRMWVPSLPSVEEDEEEDDC